jgi:hypothetical protein
MATPRPIIHTAGSWYDTAAQADINKVMIDKGFDLYDWTSDEHQRKTKMDQYWALVESIQRADVAFFSFAGMDKRTSSATFAQFNIAAAIRGKRIIVYDPDKTDRSADNALRQPLHTAFIHLMGHALYEMDNVLWTADKETALKAVDAHCAQCASQTR